MAYWIASGNRENWEVVRKHNIWGVPKRSIGLHARVKVGDTILIYARSETHEKDLFPSVIMGDYKVTELFEDTKPVFSAPPQMGEEVFPYRFRLQPVTIFKKPIEIKPLIPDLRFVTNKKMWSGHFRQAMREIPKEDYLRIVHAGKRKNLSDSKQSFKTVGINTSIINRNTEGLGITQPFTGKNTIVSDTFFWFLIR